MQNTKMNKFLIGEKEHDPMDWEGMPEFENKNKDEHKKIIVRFRNNKDYLEFQKKIEQPLSDKSTSIWYPPLVKNKLRDWCI